MDGLGLAWAGTTCSPDKGMRISMNRGSNQLDIENSIGYSIEISIEFYSDPQYCKTQQKSQQNIQQSFQYPIELNSRYTADGESQFKGKDAYTAEVKFTPEMIPLVRCGVFLVVVIEENGLSVQY